MFSKTLSSCQLEILLTSVAMKASRHISLLHLKKSSTRPHTGLSESI